MTDYMNEESPISFEQFDRLMEEEQKNAKQHGAEKQQFDDDDHTQHLTEDECFGPIFEFIDWSEDHCERWPEKRTRIGAIPYGSEEYEVVVFTEDERQVPHLHIRRKEGFLFDCCVELGTNRYDDHGGLTDVLDDELCRLFNDFMHAPTSHSEYRNHYAFAVAIWNANNPDSPVHPATDRFGVTVVPNYSTIAYEVPFSWAGEEKKMDLVARYLVAKTPKLTIVTHTYTYFTRYFVHALLTYGKEVEWIKGGVYGLTVGDVEHAAIHEESSYFREFYKENLDAACNRLCKYLKTMKCNEDDAFVRHKIKDEQLREVVDQTLKTSNDILSRYARRITGRHVMLIDDGIDRGQPVETAKKKIENNYAPTSLWVHTLKMEPHQESNPIKEYGIALPDSSRR